MATQDDAVAGIPGPARSGRSPSPAASPTGGTDGALDRAQVRFQLAFDNAPIGMILTDLTGRFLEVNRVFCDMLGHPERELLGRRSAQVTHPDDRAELQAMLSGLAAKTLDGCQYEKRYLHADGNVVTAAVSLSVVNDGAGAPQFLIAQVRDVTHPRRAEAGQQSQALHDPLTGRANGLLLRDRIEHSLNRMLRNAETLALLILDLDGFKAVNDRLGNDAGDVVLVTVADRLRKHLRPDDTVARVEGDEFAVLLENTSEQDAVAVAAELLRLVRLPMTFHGAPISVDASVGITVARAGAAAAEILRNATLALYAAKSKGTGNVQVYATSMHTAVAEQLDMEAELRGAIERHELTLAYQPIISLLTGRLRGFEALARWHHRDRGPITPAEFIPLAEATGQIVALGSWVVHEACRQIRQCQDRHPDAGPLTMAVNISVRQLEEPSLVQTVVAALAEAGLSAGQLALEITESVVMHRGRGFDTLHHLHAVGVRLAINDFGTGYSSLSRLQALPIDQVKIDKFFVDQLAGGQPSRMVAATIAMAHGLGMETVAQGVESTDQLPFLRLHGCDAGQGYLFGRPSDANGVDALLAEGGRAATVG
jgi:diguanylate cyclase (GGDEF)-like protein/PAS domain S-box-containing protein